MPPLLTVENVAELLSVSSRAVYRLVENGLPHLRLDGRRLRFREPDVEAWVADRLSTNIAPPAPAASARPIPAQITGLPPVDWSRRRR